MDSLGGPVVGNPPANAGDMGMIPGVGRSHVWEDPTFCQTVKPMYHNNRACALELVSAYWAFLPTACALQQEKSLQWERLPLEEACIATKTQSCQK